MRWKEHFLVSVRGMNVKSLVIGFSELSSNLCFVISIGARYLITQSKTLMGHRLLVSTTFASKSQRRKWKATITTDRPNGNEQWVFLFCISISWPFFYSTTLFAGTNRWIWSTYQRATFKYTNSDEPRSIDNYDIEILFSSFFFRFRQFLFSFSTKYYLNKFSISW